MSQLKINLLVCSVVIFLAATVVALEASPNSAGRITLKDGRNRIIGYIDSSGKVYNDANSRIGRVEGSARSGATYDKVGRKVARNRLPGLLFCED